VAYFVSDDAALKAFAKQAKDHVGTMASGWNQASASLGIKPPAWIWRHQGQGEFEIQEGDDWVHLKATNLVRYASEYLDEPAMAHLMRFALRAQTRSNDKTWNRYLAHLAKQSGFKLAA
jgi:hypothetical protein